MEAGLVLGPWGMSPDTFVAVIREAEAAGFSSFYVGDHFFVGPQLDSPEPYLLFTLAARETTRIRFGPLVTPVMFRAPWEVGKWSAQLDLLSGGRFVLGLGAGWQQLEHRAYGIPYPSLKERFERLDEAIRLMQVMWGPGPASFAGAYYGLEGVDALPKPAPGRPPILIGGGGEQKTLLLAAKYAAEWSAPGLSPEAFRAKDAILREHCAKLGRDPGTLRRSMLSMGPIGATQEAIDASTKQQYDRTPPPTPMSLAEYRQTLKARGGIVGGPAEIVESLGQLRAAGVDEALFVYAPGVTEFLATSVLDQVRAL